MDAPSGSPETGYIIVMGMTGSGKTTFISRLTGPHASADVGHTLSSSTTTPAHHPILDPQTHRPLVLIDTPGFDDTTRSDASILSTIASELASLHASRRPILGIVLLHRITDVRLSGSALKTFHVLRRLCGPENYDRVVLATTMWADAGFTPAGREAAVARQRRLKVYWEREDMFRGASVVMRHAQDTGTSAWRVVGAVVKLPEGKEYTPLGIQMEMEKGGAVEETEAGRYVAGEVGVERREQVREVRELERRVEEREMVLRSTSVVKRVGSDVVSTSPSRDRVDQLQKWFVSIWTSLRSRSWW